MTLATYATVSRLGRVVRTGEVAAALRTSLSNASRSLRRMEAEGLARKVRQGTWIIGAEPVDPRTIIDEITRPYPAYVSFTSALNAHGMIDQVPRDITVASLDAAKRVRTALGTYAVRHIPPELFGGWAEHDGVKLASPEKAILDLAYVSTVHLGRARHVPELDLPKGFDRRKIARWLREIPSARVRTLTARAVDAMLERAAR